VEHLRAVIRQPGNDVQRATRAGAAKGAPKPKPAGKGRPHTGKADRTVARKPGRRLAEVVADRIQEDIVARGWPVGEVLGSEAELIERFGVSRAVFREAVRIVEHHNVARMRRGPGGGLVVTEPDPRAVQNAMALYLRYKGVGREVLFEARAALEIAAVASATERITEEGIARLREVLETEEREGERAVAEAHTHHLHVVIAELTGNPAMAMFIEVLNRLNEEMILAEIEAGHREVLSVAAADYHKAHVAIVDAIASGDAALAQHRMRRHLDAILEYLH
jgi:DNA-binding FadR family transcriptional regulator